MLVIRTRNVHDVLPKAMSFLTSNGVRKNSRAGEVFVHDGPVTTVYERPRERVLFWAKRDANPFFHFMEGLWMLAGRNDVAWLSQFNSRMVQFSDNGRTFHGAYGYRWRNHFSPGELTDQLRYVAEKLKNDLNDRRAVLSIWDPSSDLCRVGKDVPCNLAAHFSVSDRGLDMIVFNRSNDIIWGCYGANAVHFSMLHEVMAAWIGVPVGTYTQVSANWHGYLDTMSKHWDVTIEEYPDPYEKGDVEPFQMVNVPIETWFQDLEIFMADGPIVGFRDRFFRRVVTPMFHAWEAYKTKSPMRYDNALEIINQCEASDWRKACIEWIERRRT